MYRRRIFDNHEDGFASMRGSYSGSGTLSDNFAFYGSSSNHLNTNNRKGNLYIRFFQPGTRNPMPSSFTFTAGSLIMQTRAVTDDGVGRTFSGSGLAGEAILDLTTADLTESALVFKGFPVGERFRWKFKGAKSSSAFDYEVIYVL